MQRPTALCRHSALPPAAAGPVSIAGLPGGALLGGLVCTLALLALLAGCSGGGSRAAPAQGEARTVTLHGRLNLQLILPQGYELQSETGATFDVYNVWRVPPLPLDKDTSLGIFVGEPTTAYCRPAEGSFRPAAFRDWRVRWHGCGVTKGPGRQIWETHLRGFVPVPIHIFILGPDGGEVERLRAIAETLVPAG